MNVDSILAAMNRHEVRYLLIGGANFLLRHEPVMTFDVDFWIEDTAVNRRRCERALAELNAAWGPSDSDWKPVAGRPSGWLDAQPLFCLTSPAGAIDIFRAVAGLTDWQDSYGRAVRGRTGGGVDYAGLSDADMLSCQLALDPAMRKNDRIAALRRAMGRDA